MKPSPCGFDRPRPVRNAAANATGHTMVPASQRHIDQLSTCHRHKISPEDGIASTVRIHSTVRNTSSQAFPKITIVTVELTWAMH